MLEEMARGEMKGCAEVAVSHLDRLWLGDERLCQLLQEVANAGQLEETWQQGSFGSNRGRLAGRGGGLDSRALYTG